jgi:two-component SAPR family response regulator
VEQFDARMKIDDYLGKLYAKIRKDKNIVSNEIMYLNKRASIPLQFISEYCDISIGSASMYLNKQYIVKPAKKIKLLEIIDIVVKRIEDDIEKSENITPFEKTRLEDIVDEGHKIIYGKAIRARERTKQVAAIPVFIQAH